MKVLVTAFKKFGNSENNYSEEVIKYINNVDKIILDVIYDEAYYELLNKYNLEEYDLIVALGEARMRKEIMIEAQAINLSSCSMPDNKGILKKDCVIIEGGEEVISTKVNIKKCFKEIQISYDAGKFVCNNIYYHLLKDFSEKSIFVHIPNCDNLEEKYIEFARKIELIISLLT